ncbi:hypothetical protein AN958_06716 [Leucoagaricus sp. SymC.cos]|nr:hypothetical protein AN958_06716 [Leucoagaricus sp. SymC.cos]
MRLLLLRPLLVHAIPLFHRGLAGLFGDDLDQPTPDLDSSPEILLTAVTQSLPTATIKTRTTAHTSHSGTTSTIVILPTTTFDYPPTTALTAQGWIMSTTATEPTPIVPEAPATSVEEATQWKVIGIGIITVGLIATVILSIIFFDSWWNFLCDIFCCGRCRKHAKNQGQEDLVPDWETRDWEFKLANEDGHRYPTMSSLADITEGQGLKDLKLVPIPSAAMLSPKPAFLLDLDPAQNSSGEPFTRGSSMQ